MLLKIRVFFVRYREGITFGILVGLLVSNIILFTRVDGNTIVIKQQIEADNTAREAQRTENIRRDEQTQRFIACIAKILAQTKGSSDVIRVDSLEKCNLAISQDTQPITKPRTQDQQVVPPNNDQPTTSRNNPTSSMPPEPHDPKPTFLDRISDPVVDLINGIKDTL